MKIFLRKAFSLGSLICKISALIEKCALSHKHVILFMNKDVRLQIFKMSISVSLSVNNRYKYIWVLAPKLVDWVERVEQVYSS